MPGGRPPIVATPEEFSARAEEFFQSGAKITITGLALALGFASRQSLTDYERRPEFSDVVKRAKLRVECAYEERMLGNNPTGAIFVLKNMGWTDKQSHEHSGPDGSPMHVAVTRKVVPAAVNRIAEHVSANGNGPHS